MSEAPLIEFPRAAARQASEPDPAPFLFALADPVRLELVRRLARGPCSVRRLSEGLPISRAAVSQHLKQLWRVGLVSYRKHGALNIYSLEPPPITALQCFLGELGRAAASSAETWRRRAAWFDRI
jgi:DNA-binding transcriptional ArsR family regulator